jgi:hypothetical protein
MNSEEEFFDPILELGHLERALAYHLPEQLWFHCAKALLILEGAGVAPWTVSRLESDNGAMFAGIGAQHLFQIRAVNHLRQIFVSAVARRGLDSERPQRVCCVLFKGRDSVFSWQAIIRYTAEVEGASVVLPSWAAETFRAWLQYEKAGLRRIIRHCDMPLH